MDLTDLLEASFRGAFFFMSVSGIEGGRKDAKHEFANSDKQLVEDLGLSPRSYNIDAIVAARESDAAGQDYRSVRDAILEALESSEGPGLFVHPFYGQIENIVVRNFTFSESITSLGEGRLTIRFEVSNTTGAPEPSTSTLSQVSNATQSAITAFEDSVLTDYNVTTSAIGNFTDSVNKLEDFLVEVRKSTSPIAALSSEIDSFNKSLSDFGVSIVGLVTNPRDLATSISGIFSGIDGLYSTANGAVLAFRGLFDFGDDDTPTGTDTFAGIERNKNRRTINDVVQSSALSYAYLNASQINYQTLGEITETANLLEVQYQKIIESNFLASASRDALVVLRAATQAFFDDTQLELRRTIEVISNPISCQRLAFQYYNSSELAADIVNLNEFSDPTRVQGNIRIFTE